MSKIELTKILGSKTFVYQPADKKWGYQGDIGMWWLEEGGKLIRPANSDEYQELTKVKKVESQSDKDKEEGDEDSANKPMGYAKAAKIRKKGFGDMFAEKILAGGGIKESLKSTFSEKGKATIKGLKQKVDPMQWMKNIGGNAGAAIYGRLRGRSQEDTEDITGLKAEKSKKSGVTDTADKISPLESGNDFLTTLTQIHELLTKREEESTKEREETNNFAEENKSEKDRRHNELIAAITGKPIKETKEKATATKEEGGDSSLGLDSFRINPKRAAAAAAAKVGEKEAAAAAAAKVGEKEAVVAGEKAAGKTATKIGKDVIKKSAVKTLGKTIGKGALKSIPILGAAIGAGFAITRLLDGDVVGAGIEAASGLGSALTAIPLTITNAARDVYKAVYGDFPDPTNSQDQKNLSEIYDICKEVAGELLKEASINANRVEDMNFDANGIATGYSADEPAAVPSKSASPAAAPAAAPASGTPAPSASPVPSPNSGQQLNSSVETNLDMKATPSNTDASTLINNNSSTIENKGTGEREPVPPVRNSEITFKRMIYNSTRVV